jgi:hypothetical protein
MEQKTQVKLVSKNSISEDGFETLIRKSLIKTRGVKKLDMIFCFTRIYRNCPGVKHTHTYQLCKLQRKNFFIVANKKNSVLLLTCRNSRDGMFCSGRPELVAGTSGRMSRPRTDHPLARQAETTPYIINKLGTSDNH